MSKGEEIQACDDFYKFANRKWFEKDEPIPAEYSQWGSFHKLRDNSLFAQIKLLQELSAKETPTADEKKILAIAQASVARFSAWAAGEGDLSELVGQLQDVESTVGALDDVQSYAKGLGRVLADFHLQNIEGPFKLSAGASLVESDSMLLNAWSSGLSMTSRDHYLSESFEQQRGYFKTHLQNVAAIVGESNLVSGFAERVFRFETKLAMITMTQPQKRQYDKYFSTTTLDNFVAEVNDLTYLEDKEANYEANSAHPLSDTLPDVFKSKKFALDEDTIVNMGILLSEVADILEIRETLAKNCEANYPGETSEDRVFRMVCFDGDYFRRVVALLLSEDDRQDVVAFLQYKAVKAARELLTKDLDEEFFNFYDRELSGQKEQKSEEKRTVAIVNEWVGMLLGQLYVKEHFPPAEKENLLLLINEVLAVMENSLTSLEWMTQATREKALKKLSTFKPKIGFPDKWESFDQLELDAGDSLLEIAKKVAFFRHQKDFLGIINTPKDKTKWGMTPQTVNAYYSPSSNEICFPAAILQPPFYYKNLDEIDAIEFDLAGIPKDTPGLLDALNCGGICSVIAHEIGHGFDDQGSKYDGYGNLVNWWADEDRKQFSQKCDLMASQVLKWELVGDHGDVHKLKPDLVMGECLADIAGVSLAVGAMLRKLSPNAGKRKSLVGKLVRKSKRLSGRATKEDAANAKLRIQQLQIFCRSWATVWRSKSTLAYSIKLTAIDPHAPASFRGNVIGNIPEFYEAFDIPEGSNMYIPEEERVKLW